jgi:hypothetical protein
MGAMPSKKLRRRTAMSHGKRFTQDEEIELIAQMTRIEEIHEVMRQSLQEVINLYKESCLGVRKIRKIIKDPTEWMNWLKNNLKLSHQAVDRIIKYSVAFSGELDLTEKTNKYSDHLFTIPEALAFLGLVYGTRQDTYGPIIDGSERNPLTQKLIQLREEHCGAKKSRPKRF